MSALVIAGLEVPVAEGQIAARRERVGASTRAYNGNLRSTVRYEKRAWQLTTGLLTQAELAALTAATALAAHVACSGDVLGEAVTCEVEVGDAGYTTTPTADGLGFLRSVALTLREV